MEYRRFENYNPAASGRSDEPLQVDVGASPETYQQMWRSADRMFGPFDVTYRGFGTFNPAASGRSDEPLRVAAQRASQDGAQGGLTEEVDLEAERAPWFSPEHIDPMANNYLG